MTTPSQPTPLLVPPINLTSPVPTSKNDAVAYYAGLLQQSYGKAVAQSYLGYVKTHPNLTAYDALQQWAGYITAHLGPGLAKAIQAFVNDAGTNVQQFGTGVTSGLGSSSQDWQHLLLRFAEFGIGMSLILVGVFVLINNSQTAKSAKRNAVDLAAAAKTGKIIK